MDDLLLLPGELVRSVDAETPVMVGEFAAADGSRYIMVVNLSLERSTKVELTTSNGTGAIQVVSAASGVLQEIDEKSGLWLVAGQGVLLKL